VNDALSMLGGRFRTDWEVEGTHNVCWSLKPVVKVGSCGILLGGAIFWSPCPRGALNSLVDRQIVEAGCLSRVREYGWNNQQL
jgi:hypothetical protein